MTRTIFSILSALALLLIGGCAKEGTVYDAPIDKVYDKLADLDLGADIGSALFRYYDKSPPVGSVPNETVTWHMGKANGTDVIAHLSDEGSGKTRVFVEIAIPEANMQNVPGPLQGMLKNLIRERIAAHLEDRPFDDKKYIDAMYGGPNSLVPKEFRDQVGGALKMDAEMQRERAKQESDGPSDSMSDDRSSSVTSTDVRSAAPMVDTSKYNH